MRLGAPFGASAVSKPPEKALLRDVPKIDDGVDAYRTSNFSADHLTRPLLKRQETWLRDNLAHRSSMVGRQPDFASHQKHDRRSKTVDQLVHRSRTHVWNNLISLSLAEAPAV